MALEWSDALVLFSNNAVAGSDRRSVRTGAGRRQRQNLAPGRHAGSSSCGMTRSFGSPVLDSVITKDLHSTPRFHHCSRMMKYFLPRLRCQGHHLLGCP
jgi:hypothetical protein